MSLLGRLKALTRMVFGRTSQWSGTVMPRSRYDFARQVGDGMSSSVVAAPVLWIARTLPEAPIVIERDDELERDHAMARLLRNPNPFYSGHVMEMALAISITLNGNAYILKIRNGMRGVVQLWFVPWWMMKPVAPDDGSVFISHYDYSPLGIPMPISPDDVVHLRYGLDPRSIRLGLGQLTSLLREVFTDDEAAAFTASILRNAGVPGLIASPATETAVISDADMQDLKEKLKHVVSGDRRGEPLVMRGPTKVEQFGFNPQQMDLAKLREIPEERVCAVLGIPAAVVGFGSGLAQTKVGATMAEMREMAYESCIIPMQGMIAADLDRQLLPDFESDPDSCRTVFDLSRVRVLQEDQNRKAVRVNTMVQGGWMTVARAKQEMGEDALPGDDVYLRSFGMEPVPAGVVSSRPLAQAVEDDADEEPEDDESKRRIAALDRELGLLTKADVGDDGRRFALRQLREQRRLAGVFALELAAAFRGIGDEAAASWSRYAAAAGVETLGAASPQTKRVTEDELRRLVGIVMQDVSAHAIDYGPHYIRVALATVDGIRSAFGLGVNLSEPMEMRILAEGGRRQGLVDLGQQTRDALFQTLSEARDAGAGPREIAQLIRDQVPAGPWSSPQVRADVIARTETKHAQNVASLEAYRASDNVTAIQLVDGQLGDRSCDECRARDGQVVSIDEAELIMREHEHPNGTLSLTPVIGRASHA